MIVLDKVSKQYNIRKGVKIKALNDISLTINSRGMLFIVGKSGSGKSSLINLICGIEKANSGKILYNETDISKLNSKEMNQYRSLVVSLIFQEHNLIEDYNVYKNIALASEIIGKVITKDEIDILLSKLGLDGLGDRMVYQLSGGQRQRASIARALVKDPNIIIADEPTASLDPQMSEEILRILKELSQEKLVIIVCHDKNSANKYGDRIIELSKGTIIGDSNNSIISEKFIDKKDNKGKLSFKNAFMLGYLTLKKRRKRLIITTILSVICLVILGLADVIYSFNKESFMNDSIEQLGVNYLPFRNVNYQDKFSNEEIIEIKKNDQAITLIPIYSNLGGSNRSIKFEEFSMFYSETFYGGVSIDDNLLEALGFKILAGKLPNSSDPNTFAISEFVFRAFKKYGFVNPDGNISTIENYSDIVGKSTSIGDEMYTICGVIDTNFNYDRYEIIDKEFNHGDHNLYALVEEMNGIRFDSFINLRFVNEEMVSKYNHETRIDTIIGVFDNNQNRKKLIKYLYENDNKEYFIQNEVSEYIIKVDKVHQQLNKYFLYFLIGSALFSFILIYLLINESITLRIREIGILRSLGASQSDIFKIFYSEGAIIAAIISGIGFVTFSIVVFIMNNYLKVKYLYLINLLNISIKQLAIFIGFCLFVCFLSTIIPIIKNSRKSLAQIIALNRE